MLNVSKSKRIIQWMALPTFMLSVLILGLHGNAFASGAVIVTQLDTIGKSTPSPSPTPVQPHNEVANSTSRFQIVVKDYAEDDDNRLVGISVSPRNETEISNSTMSLPTTTKSPSNHARRSLKSGGMVSQGSSSAASRNNTQLLSVLAARRSLLHHSRNGNVPHQRGVHNYVIQQTMCERNCTKNFTVRGSAQCMRRCAVPSPARQREHSTVSAAVPEESSKINQSLDNDNNLSESNAIGSVDEILVTNESTAAHLIYREIFDATNNSKGIVNGGGGGNLLERGRGKKNATVTKDLYSPTKNGQYYIESRTKRPRKPSKFEGDILEFGQKLAGGSFTKEPVITEKPKMATASPRSVTMPRNLVASHRRGMLNFKSSLLSNPSHISAIPTRPEPFDVPSIDEIFTKPVLEDARTEESRAAVSIVTVEPANDATQPPPSAIRKNHGILLDLPPSTIQLDVRGSGGFETSPDPFDHSLTETTENGIQESVEERTIPSIVLVVSASKGEALTKHIVASTEKLTTPDSNISFPTTTETHEVEPITASPPSTEDPVIVKPSIQVIPSISALFPNITAVPFPLHSSETDLVIPKFDSTTSLSEPILVSVESQRKDMGAISTTTTNRLTSTSSTTEASHLVEISPTSTTPPAIVITTIPTQISTTERVPYKPSPSRGYKPSTQKPPTTLRPLVPKRTEFTLSSIDSGDFRRTTLNPVKRFSPRPKKTSTSTESSTTTSTTSATTTNSPQIKVVQVHEEKKIIEQPPNTSFESIFNLSEIFPKFPQVQVTTEVPLPTTLFPIKSVPEPDSVLLQPNTDVTIELQRMNMATYVLAGLGMFPIVIIILYVIKTIIYNKQLKNSPQAVPVDAFGDHKISPVVMKIDGSSEHEDDILKEVELNRKNLRFKSILGEGNFGQVWKAEADDLPGHMGTTRIVAVKTERPEHGTGGLKQEAEIMFKLGSHPNVVTLLGCCIQEEPHLLIMEFAMRGRLLSLLRAARNAIHSMGGHVGTTRSSAIPLSPRRLSGFAHDIARGMEYITSKNIVHRDLAARNILLDHNGVCKICDFGMSMDLKKHKPTAQITSRAMGRAGLMHHNSFENNMLWENESSGHKPSGSCQERRMEVCRSDSGVGGSKPPTRPALPIRWMAPEALLHHIFSIETDIWAFGIVLWEIATLGCTPYPNLSGREVVRSIPSGVRPEIPPNCRPELYKLMAKTWHKDPRQRPTFTEARNELAHALRQWEMEQENTSEYLDVSGFSEDLEHGMVYFNRRISEFECEI